MKTIVMSLKPTRHLRFAERPIPPPETQEQAVGSLALTLLALVATLLGIAWVCHNPTVRAALHWN